MNKRGAAGNRRILLVANVAWNIYNFRMNLVERLLKDGWQISVAAREDEYTSFIKSIKGVTFIPLQKIKKSSQNPIHDLSLIFEFIKIYKRCKPDFIVHYTIKPNVYGGLAARFLNIPYFSLVTGLGYSFIHKGWLNHLVVHLYRLGLSNSQNVIFENTDDPEEFVKLGIISKGKGAAVNGCGVNIDFFKSNGEPPPRDRFIYTYIGRLLYDKGLSELIEAFRQVKLIHPEAELWLTGKRDKENPAYIKDEDMSTWLEEEGVFYKGYMDDVRPVIERSHCIVYPSYREGMPRVVLEAMSMQKPVITTDVPGCRETIVDGEHGYIVEAKQAKALFEAMNRIIEKDNIDLGLMGQKGRTRVEELFNHLKIAENLKNIFYSALHIQPHNHPIPGEVKSINRI